MQAADSLRTKACQGHLHYLLRQPGRGRRYRVPSGLQGPVPRCSRVRTIECAASFLLKVTTQWSMMRDCLEIVLHCRASVTDRHLSPDSPIIREYSWRLLRFSVRILLIRHGAG